MQTEDANSIFSQGGTELFIPTEVLLFHKLMGFAVDQFAFFYQGQTVSSSFGIPVFQLLHQAGNTDFEKLVQIAGSNRKEF